jgi:serine/threonine protein kinase/WD40 repeat protein/tetratricopeptide (TPR) repeat protein
VGPQILAEDSRRESSENVAHSAELEQPGDHIGRYKLRERIGEGGCGVVYVAEQEEPVRRRVALKVIKLGMDTRSVVARFEAERQALAMMDHPNIAKVLDAGTTSTGRPFFVMELVRGIRITEYCDQYRLSTEERLKLFILVCHAVQHAHQKGIIHRDLKPSNILVTLHDGQPVPKIIDFGIAKAIEGRLTEKTIYSELHQFIGTPAYMSPEQAEMSGLDIDTRSDIYSLGVLLYELLTGRTPFDAKALLSSGLDALRRAIREMEPPKPSTRLGTLLEADQTTLARTHAMEVPKLVSLIRGDLDWIVMKALEKDRTRRYDTANGFALDVRRFLSNEAVLARPPSSLYRFGKFVRRNRLSFAAASAVSAAVVLGLGVSTSLFLKERQSHRRATGAEATATAHATRAAAAAEESRQNLLRLQISNGARLMESGDLMRALPWFAALFKNDQGQNPQKDAEHRLLLASILQQCPRPVQMWFHENSPAVALSPDGKLALTGARSGLSALWDVKSGRRVSLAQAVPMEKGTPKCNFSARGQSAAFYGDENSTAIIWDLRSPSPRSVSLSTGERIRHMALSPDGRFCVTCGERRWLTVWDVGTGELRYELAGPTMKVDAPRFISGADARRVFGANAADSSQVLLAVDRTGFVGVWDVGQGTLLAERRVTPSLSDYLVHHGEFSPDGRLLLLPEGASGMVIFGSLLWNVAQEKLVATLKHEHHVHDVAFSADGRTLVTSSQDQTARIWDAETGTLRGIPLQHPEPVHGIAISPAGHLLATVCSDRTVRLWHIENGQPAGPPLLHASGVRNVDFGGDDATVATTSRDGVVRVWNLAAAPKWSWAGSLDSADDVFALNHPLDTHNDASWGAALRHPKGVALLGLTNSEIKVLSVPPGSVPKMVTLSRDGKRAMVLLNRNGTNEFRLWSAETGQPLGPRFWVPGDLSADGTRCFALNWRGGKGVLQVCDTLTGKITSVPLGPTIEQESSDALGKLGKVEYSADGHTVTAAVGNQVRVWNADNGQMRFPPLEYPVKAAQLVISPNSQRLAVACDGPSDSTRFLEVWDLKSGRLAGPRLAQVSAVDYIAFDSSGKRVVTTKANQARVWDVATGQPAAPIMEGTRPLEMAAFSPDDRRVVSESGNGVARIWDASTAVPLIAPLPHGNIIRVGLIAQRAMLVLNNSLLFTFSAEPRCWEMPSDERTVAQWEKIAMLISGRRLDLNGTLEPLDASTLSNLWSAVRTESPGDFSPSPARRYDWNIWRADLAMAAFDSRGALPHLNELVAVEPERLRFRSMRARVLESLREWEAAAAELRTAVAMAPNNVYLWSRLAGAELASGHAPAYRAACDVLVGLARDEDSSDVIKLILTVVSVGSNSPVTLNRLSKRLDSLPHAGRWRESGYLAFRLGRYEEAIWLLSDDKTPRSRLFAAMTYQALGQRAEAKMWMKKVRALWRDSKLDPELILSMSIPAGRALNDFLLEEAEAMVR